MNLKIRLGLQVVLSSVLLFAASVDFAGLGKLKAASQKFGKPIISTPTVFQPVVKKARQKGAVRQSQGTHGGFENQNGFEDQNKTQRQTGKEFGLRQANGVLNEIAVPLAKLLKFKRRGKHLVFELPSSYSEADEAFRKIRSQARGGGGGHSSGEFWTQYVSNQNFGGRIQKSEQNIGGVRKTGLTATS